MRYYSSDDARAFFIVDVLSSMRVSETALPSRDVEHQLAYFRPYWSDLLTCLSTIEGAWC